MVWRKDGSKQRRNNQGANVMNLTVRTWITFVILAIVMALTNIYSTLLTGWGDSGSIISVVLCLIFLSRKEGTIINYNLGQTMASAGGSVGFTTAMLAAVYILDPTWNPPLIKLSLMVAALSFLGVALAVPLRRYIVKWFFPSGVACATILKAVTSDDEAKRAKAQNIMGISGIIAAVLTFPTKVAFTAGGTTLWSKITLSKTIGISLDPLMYGIGIVVGPKIGISMIIAALATAFWLVPGLTDAGVAEGEIGDYVKWSAIGFMTLPAFASIYFAFKFKSERKLPTIFEPRAEEESDKLTTTEWRLLGVGTAVALVVATWLVYDLFGVNPVHIAICIAIGGLSCIMLGKVMSETDINPVRLGAIVMLFVISLLASYGPVSLLGLGIIGAAMAALCIDLFQDLRTGYLIGANPRQQVWVQIFGTLAASAVTVFFLHMLATSFGFGEDKYFPAPGSMVWAGMAKAFAAGGANLSKGVWIAFGIASTIGVILSFLENHPKTKAFTPSSLGMGIAMLLPFDMGAAIFLGGALRFLVTFLVKRRKPEAEESTNDVAFHVGSAIIAAAALTGIVAVILITLGVVHLPGKGH